MPPSTQSPNPDYNFIMQNGQQPAKPGFKMPGMKSPKMIVMIVGAILGIAILIVIFSLFTGKGGGGGQAYVTAMARGTEIIRVSALVGQVAQDSPTQNLATTVQNSLGSDQAQISGYLASAGYKFEPTLLAVDKDATTDTQMQTAATNGNLNSIYASYLKTELATYSQALQQAYKSASVKGKAVLTVAYNSVQVILGSPQIAKAN